MSRELSNVQKSTDIALGKNHNVVIHGIPEPFMGEEKQRKRAVRYIW